MGRYYNEHYNYKDIGLWDDEAWKDRGSIMGPLAAALARESRAQQEAAGTLSLDRFAGRTDEEMPAPARAPFFRDVLEEWKALGLQFVSVGMVDLAMVPMSVVRRENHSPRVLLVPFFADKKHPHWAMNVIEANRELLLRAAAEEVFVLFQMMGPPNGSMMQETGLEAEGLFKVTLSPMYLDLHLLTEAGKTIADIPGVDAEQFGPIQSFLGLDVVEVTQLWQASLGHQYTINKIYTSTPHDPKNPRPSQGVPGYDEGMHRHSTAGRLQAESMLLEHKFRSTRDPELQAALKDRGLRYKEHPIDDFGFWFSIVPESVYTKPEEKLPLLVIMKEPRTSIPFMNLTAMQFYAPFLEIAANGEFMTMFFAFEHPDDNDILADLIERCAAEYPVDRSRIYITGQSHNGYYALEFYRRHPKLIAAAATLADPISLEVGALITNYGEDFIPESFAQFDLPLININGQLENKMTTTPAGSPEHRLHAKNYVRRLQAFRAKNRYTVDEVMAARSSGDYVTRTNGIPADRTEVQYHLGTELYFSDVMNEDGRWHLRFVTIENTPHMIMPQMGEVAWSFMRRFARDPETGAVIERY